MMTSNSCIPSQKFNWSVVGPLLQILFESRYPKKLMDMGDQTLKMKQLFDLQVYCGSICCSSGSEGCKVMI